MKQELRKTLRNELMKKTPQELRSIILLLGRKVIHIYDDWNYPGSAWGESLLNRIEKLELLSPSVWQGDLERKYDDTKLEIAELSGKIEKELIPNCKYKRQIFAARNAFDIIPLALSYRIDDAISAFENYDSIMRYLYEELHFATVRIDIIINDTKAAVINEWRDECPKKVNAEMERVVKELLGDQVIKAK